MYESCITNRSIGSSTQLDELVAQLSARLANGEPIDLAALTAECPQYREQLEMLLPTLRAVVDLEHCLGNKTESLATSDRNVNCVPYDRQQEEAVAGQLGDFRIVRELGRGGMGIVYEAEQISLGRRVALKVLPFAAMLDKQQLTRFKNEARAAATLDHPNIVAVHSVGADRGVHYYAMQLIEGQSLAQVIAAQRQATAPDSTAATSNARLSTLPDHSSREYFRAIARLGIQAAEALDHAHVNGILHRDIKPANLLVDDSGKLWITDFGLARMEQDAGMTMTGDLLGTLRYMSPEQALAKRVIVDHRSDVYSLGVTLYELIALRPVFPTDDRQELLRQIAFEEPRKPGQLNSRIPHDVETIVLKAIEKNPPDRYGTAQQLAEDLKRFLDNRPIAARRPKLVGILTKWARRNRSMVWASAATILLSTLALAASVGWVARDRAARRLVIEGTASAALDEAERLIKEHQLPDALAAAQRAADLLTDSDSNRPVLQRTEELLKDVQMALKLEDLPLTGDIEGEYKHSRPHKEAEDMYYQTFCDFGIDVEALDPLEAAELIQSRVIRANLAAAIDDWILWRRLGPRDVYPGRSSRTLIPLARLIDPDPWNNRVRDALQLDTREKRKAAIGDIGKSIQGKKLPLRTMQRIANLLDFYEHSDLAIKLLRELQRQQPDSFYGNYDLAVALGKQQRRTHEMNNDERIRFLTAALAVRPQHAPAHQSLAVAFHQKGSLEEAIVHYKKAIEINPDFALAHNNLAVAYLDKGMPEEAIPHLHEALRIEPERVRAIDCLGSAMIMNGRLEEGIQHLQRAIRLRPDLADTHAALGVAFYKQGLKEKALSYFQEALRLQSDYPATRTSLAQVEIELGRAEEGMENYMRALRSYCRQGRWGEAQTTYDEAVKVLEENKVAPQIVDRLRTESTILRGVNQSPEAKPDLPHQLSSPREDE